MLAARVRVIEELRPGAWGDRVRRGDEMRACAMVGRLVFFFLG